jgi:signal transduction histidine kinase/CheY-like chemotaxis protein
MQASPTESKANRSQPVRLRSRLPLYALAAASLLLPALIFAVAAWENWRQLERATDDRAAKRTALVAEHALKVFESNEQVLRRVEERVAGLGWDEIAASTAISDFLDRLDRELDHVEGVGLIRPDGRLAAVSGMFPTPPLDVSDRDYFKGARGATERAHVGAAVQGRLSNQSLFRLVRQRSGPDGAFDGAIFVSMSPDYFLRFYNTITDGHDAVTMARVDGSVLSREPAVTTGALVLSPRSGFMRGITRAERGTYRTISELDRVERLHAYQRVGPYPVFVSYGYSLRRLSDEWWGNVLTFGIVTALASLALFGLSLLVLRRAVQEQRLFADFRGEVARREAAEEALRQSHKMEAVGQLTGGIAHDFNNLLTVVLGNLELAKRHLASNADRATQGIDNALAGAKRAAALTQRLLAFSRRQPLEPRPVDINRLVAGTSDLLGRTLGESIAIETVLAAGLWPVEVDPNQLENALLNLAVNARDAMPNGGKLTIETANAFLDEAYAASHAEVEPGQYVAISVTDTGAGMPAEVVERAFEPFFTTKETGHGTGLGLSMVYGFVKQSGGHVKIYSEAGQGTTLRIYLPRLAGATAVPEEPPAEEAPAAAAGAAVLVVEDDPDVRAHSARSLRDLGYAVVEAADGPTALRRLDESTVDLLFTDVGLPGMNGRELVEEALRRRPGLKVLFTTGYARNAIVHHGRLDPGLHLLVKPYTQADLAAKVRRVLAEPTA